MNWWRRNAVAVVFWVACALGFAYITGCLFYLAATRTEDNYLESRQ